MATVSGFTDSKAVAYTASKVSEASGLAHHPLQMKGLRYSITRPLFAQVANVKTSGYGA
jgi:hypothetical protein